MFLKKITFLAVSIIVGGIFIYTFYDNIFTTVYCYEGPVNPVSILNAMHLQHLEAYAVVPINGYDITDPRVFYHILNNRTCEITYVQLHQGLAYAIRVDNRLYTVDPDLIKLLMYIIKHFIPHPNYNSYKNKRIQSINRLLSVQQLYIPKKT
jgi:hypothetical protein